MNEDSILFLVGEVVTGYDNTLKYIASGSVSTTNKLFTIQVRVINRFTKQFDVYTCRPFNMNFKQIPLIGEHVLIFRAYSQETTLDGTNIEWYYLNPYSIQSSVNANLVPAYLMARQYPKNKLAKLNQAMFLNRCLYRHCNHMRGI